MCGYRGSELRGGKRFEGYQVTRHYKLTDPVEGWWDYPYRCNKIGKMAMQTCLGGGANVWRGSVNESRQSTGS